MQSESLDSRQFRRQPRNHGFHQPPREENTSARTQHAQRQRFRHKLAAEALAARSQGDTHRHFARLRARTSHEQYSKVQTADQQQTSGSSQKGKERPAYRERLAVRERLRQRSNPLVTGSVGNRILPRQAARQGGYFRTNLL
jgi:hypothetical protein